jgi:ribosome-associated heat shock protein Hsp15
VRADKFLWSVRLYKTRTIAAEACKSGKVFINNVEVKPSRTVLKGETIILKKSPITYTYRVIDLAGSRVSAKLATHFIENLTPKEELAKLEIDRSAQTAFREKGAGRPTKKDRRVIDRMKQDFNGG